MSLLANLVSEDVTLPPPSSIKGKGKERKVPERTEVSKIIAACTGAVVTSLTSELKAFFELRSAKTNVVGRSGWRWHEIVG